MISLFDADDAFTDDSAMGYQRYTTDFKLACLKRYFTPPMKPVRDLSAELGVPFSTLAEWVTKARKAGMLNPGEPLPAMVEVGAALPSPAEEPPAPMPATVTVSIGKATVTTPSSLLSQALEALPALEASPGSLLDRALRYMDGLGDELYTFLSDGRVPMDNNLAERYLAWLFENARKLSVERLMPWSDDVPDSARHSQNSLSVRHFGRLMRNAEQKHPMLSILGNHLSIRLVRNAEQKQSMISIQGNHFINTK